MISTRTSLLVLVMTVAVGLAACQKQPTDDSAVLATVNGEKITEKDYQHYLQLRQTRQEPIADKDKERKIVLDEMVDRVLAMRKR